MPVVHTPEGKLHWQARVLEMDLEDEMERLRAQAKDFGSNAYYISRDCNVPIRLRERYSRLENLLAKAGRRERRRLDALYSKPSSIKV